MPPSAYPARGGKRGGRRAPPRIRADEAIIERHAVVRAPCGRPGPSSPALRSLPSRCGPPWPWLRAVRAAVDHVAALLALGSLLGAAASRPVQTNSLSSASLAEPGAGGGRPRMRQSRQEAPLCAVRPVKARAAEAQARNSQGSFFPPAELASLPQGAPPCTQMRRIPLLDVDCRASVRLFCPRPGRPEVLVFPPSSKQCGLCERPSTLPCGRGLPDSPGTIHNTESRRARAFLHVEDSCVGCPPALQAVERRRLWWLES